MLRGQGHSEEEIAKILDHVRHYELEVRTDSVMDSIAGGTFDLAGPDALTMRAFYKVLSRVLLGREKATLPVPRALVRAGGARIIFEREYQRQSNWLESIPPSLAQLLDQNGISYQGWLFDKSFRWSEYYLEPGENVCVRGAARQEVLAGEQGQGYRDLPTRWVMEAPQSGPLIIIDTLREDFLRRF